MEYSLREDKKLFKIKLVSLNEDIEKEYHCNYFVFLAQNHPAIHHISMSDI